MKRMALPLALATLAACSTSVEPASTSADALSKGPLALEGTYRFAGHVTPLGRKTVDVIDTRMPDADERLEEVRGNGGTCQLAAANTWRCVTLGGDVAASSLETLGQRNAALFARFDAVTGAPSLVTDGESFKEWEISQDGATPEGTFERYVHRLLQGDLAKIVVNGEELIVRDAGHLAKWDMKTVTESRWRWHEDAALVVLER